MKTVNVEGGILKRSQFFLMIFSLGVVVALCNPTALLAQTEIPYVWVGGEPNPLPQWCREQEVPKADAEHDYFMGWSVTRPQKNVALQEAKISADKKIARKAGIDVQIISESRTPSDAEKNQEAFHVEITEWEPCIQTYAQGEGGQNNVYLAGVVLQFPQSEYARIRQWKEEQAYQNEEAIKEFIESARQLALKGQAIGALELLQEAAAFAQKIEAKQPKAKQAKAALLETIQQEEQAIAKGVRLEFVTAPGFETYVSQFPQPIQARVHFFYESKNQPLSSGFPVALHMDAEPFPPQRSNEAGLVQFALEKMKQEGEVNLTIQPGASLAERISPYAYDVLRATQDQLSFAVTLSPEIKTLMANAQRGNVEAQANLGWRYLTGDEVGQDNTQAVRWLQQAAEQGNVEAQANLGWWFLQGDKGADAQKAVRWLQQAAAQGEATAQNNLGWMYETGNGVTKNNASAYMWFSIAETNGSKWAAQNKKTVARRMNVATIAEAEKRVQACYLNNYKGC